jgi:hypothetical protein
MQASPSVQSLMNNSKRRIRTEWPGFLEALGVPVVMGSANLDVGSARSLNLALNPRLEGSVAASARGQTE